MASVNCPECGERVKLRDDGKRLRCPDCGEKFDPPEEEEEEEAPRPRTKRKPAAKKSSGTKFAAIIVGGVLLLGVAGLVIALVFRKSDKDGDTAPPTDQAKVTLENFQRVKPGMDVAEVEGVLGSGKSSSESDMRSALSAGLGEMAAAVETGWARFGAGGEWRRWDGTNFRVWVAFGKTKQGQRAAYSTALAQDGNKYKLHPGFMTWAQNSNLDELNAQRKKTDAVRDDPKWVRGAKARELLVGDWRKADLDGYVFDGTGKLTSYSLFNSSTDGKVTTYRILDDDHVELMPPQLHPNLPSRPRKTEFRVNQDELVLLSVDPSSIAKVSGPYYRIPVEPGRPGHTHILAPLTANLTSGVWEKQFQGFRGVRRLGKSGVAVLPTLIELVRDTNENVASESISVIAGLREDGAPAVPALLEQLRKPNTKRGLTAVFTLGMIGPSAKDALPTLKSILANSKEFSEYRLRDAATESIARIEGRKK